jgi:release factor glutamine methyltransferase
MIRKDLLQVTKDYFKAQDIPTVDADLLLAHLLQCNKGEVQLKLMKLDEDQTRELDRELRRLVLRRQNGEPTQYIIGSAPFRYLNLKVGPGVLIPRPETESLVELVKVHITALDQATLIKPVEIVDLGSGSGCVAISLATEECGKDVDVTAVEKSPEAFEWLQANVIATGAKVKTVLGDVATACEGERFDVVVANPPYIPKMQILPINVRFEPAEALFGGAGDGMEIPRHFIEASARLLKCGGYVAIEHHESQSEAMANALESDFIDIKNLNDLTGRPRFTTAIRKKRE